MPLSNVFEIKKPRGAGGGLTKGFTLVVNRALSILLFKLVLFFSLTESNVTLVPPTPTPPLLLSSEYFEFTLQWTEYSQRYNDSPVIFVLEVKRHENISDPASFLPVIKKYHTVSICWLQYAWFWGEELLNKVLHLEFPPRGPTPYPFIYTIFDRKGPSLVYVPSIEKWHSFNIFTYLPTNKSLKHGHFFLCNVWKINRSDIMI